MLGFGKNKIIKDSTFRCTFLHFVLCSLNRTVGFAEGRMRLNNKNKTHFILYCVHLIVPLASPKVGCASTIKIKLILFCIVFGFHYLCKKIG